jgi:hypothetical protein
MTPAPRTRSARAWFPAAALAAVAVVASLGCRRDIHLLPDVSFGDGGEAGLGGAAGADAAVDRGPGIDAAPACTGLGPPITLPTAGSPTCAAALTTRAHQFAVCTCNVDPIPIPLTTLGARLRTYAFDSTNSSYSDDKISAAVGIDGALMTNADLEVEGAIYVAGGYVAANGHLQAGASFRSGGPLTMQGSQQADLLGDASVNGYVSGDVNVSGTLYVPTALDVGSDVEAKAISLGPAPYSAPWPPCDCSSGFVNVASAIMTAQYDNGDEAAGFDPNVLAVVSSATQLTLGCGTYYLNAINATAPVTLVVHGRALLAVNNSLSVTAGLTVTLDSSAELDLLVGGWINASGGTVGAPSAPARFRIWTSSTDSLTFNNQPTIAAVVHAPFAQLSAPQGVTLSGSLFVDSLNLTGDSEVHYDRAILSIGQTTCGEPVATVPL